MQHVCKINIISNWNRYFHNPITFLHNQRVQLCYVRNSSPLHSVFTRSHVIVGFFCNSDRRVLATCVNSRVLIVFSWLVLSLVRILHQKSIWKRNVSWRCPKSIFVSYTLPSLWWRNKLRAERCIFFFSTDFSSSRAHFNVLYKLFTILYYLLINYILYIWIILIYLSNTGAHHNILLSF